VDRATAIPNSTGTFTVIDNKPALSGANVVFLGAGDSEQHGIYFFESNALRRVADTATAIPDGTGAFTDFDIPVVSGSNVAFRGLGRPGQDGIYFFDGSALSRVVDRTTPIPNSTAHFSFISRSS